jgi:DNA-binding beta-propeller fold protein YncE
VADQASGDVVVYPPGELSRLPVRLLGFPPKPLTRWRAVEDGAAAPVLSGLAVGPDGTVFVADAGADRIRAFDGRGQLLTAWGQSGAGLGQLSRPASLAVGPTGEVYVADSGNGRVERFEARGTVQEAWSGEGLPEASLGEVAGLAVDARGNLFITQRANGRLIELDSDGRLVGFWTGQELGGIARATGLASRAGALYVADPDLRRVWTLTATGVEGTPWRATWREAGRLQSPASVAPDPRGDLYILDSRGGGVLVLRGR